MNDSEKKNTGKVGLRAIMEGLEKEAGGPMPTTDKQPEPPPQSADEREADRKAAEMAQDTMDRFEASGFDMILLCFGNGDQFFTNPDSRTIFSISGNPAWVVATAFNLLSSLTGMVVGAVVAQAGDHTCIVTREALIARVQAHVEEVRKRHGIDPESLN